MPQTKRNAGLNVRVLWAHNFNPEKRSSLVFINTTADGVRARGVEVRLEYLGNLRSISNLVRARARLKGMARDYDLVHAHYGSACALATAGVAGVPKVLSVRGNDWNTHNASFGFLYWHTRIARLMSKQAIPSFDYVLAVSNRIASELRQVFPKSRIETLPSPINLNKFVSRDKAEARARLGFPGCSDRWILFNALDLDDPIKRYKLARRAFELASVKIGNLRLQIANDLPHDQLPLFVAACDLILCTSETEGWPNSVKEALACNVPFVSTDVSDLGDIANQEPTCRVCPPNASVLADAIVEVLTSSGHPNLQKYVANMSLDASSDRLVCIYESLLSEHKAVVESRINNCRRHDG